MCPRLLCVLVFAAMSVIPTRAIAGNGLTAPAEVVLYIHADMKRTAFIRPLVCALQRVLVAPVSTQVSTLPLGPALRASATQFDVTKVADEFIRSTPTDQSHPTFQYLLLPFDLKAEPWRYVFATSFGNGQTVSHVGIISTARLDADDPLRHGQQDAEVTANRVYKLVLKSIARVAGLTSPDRCVLIFPRSLDELDHKTAQFCQEDRATLVAAGILRTTETTEGTDCAAVSDAMPEHSAGHSFIFRTAGRAGDR